MIDLHKFVISSDQYIQVIPDLFTPEDCEVCNKSIIEYVDEKKNIVLKIDYITSSTFCYFIGQSGIIQKLIDGKLFLDNTITPNLGYEWNESFYDSKKPNHGSMYHAFSNSHLGIRPYSSCWLYNDKDGNVIFDVTPFYPWHSETKKTCPEKISYKKWIQTYAPTLKTVIPKENLKKWISQALELKKSLGLHKE